MSGEFSGKISYELDNGESFEVYRNFTKKQPQILDKNANDISKNFMVDKTEGNKFFYEQTKVDEDLFNMSMIIHQQEVRLDNRSRNTLIQKASNIMLTGEDNISYQKVLGKLNKRQTDEIGTIKSPTKPLYLAKKSVEDLYTKKDELERLAPLKYEIDEEIKKKQKEILEEEEMLKILQEMDSVSREARLEEEKIQIHVKAKEELEKQKELFETSLNNIEPLENYKKPSNLLYNIPGVLFTISVILFFILQKPIIGIVLGVASVISFLIILLSNLKKSKDIKEKEEENRDQRRNIENKIELTVSEIEAKDNLIKENKEALELSARLKKEQIRLKYPNAKKLVLESNVNIIEEQNYINNLKLGLSQKELEIKQITEKLEELARIEEKLNISQETYNNLLEYDEVIQLAKEALEKAYLEMKESITPKFTQNLSNLIYKITSGKYKKVKVNDESGLLLEAENRKLYYCKSFKPRHN